jgi:hypothetical protein
MVWNTHFAMFPCLGSAFFTPRLDIPRPSSSAETGQRCLRLRWIGGRFHRGASSGFGTEPGRYFIVTRLQSGSHMAINLYKNQKNKSIFPGMNFFSKNMLHCDIF